MGYLGEMLFLHKYKYKVNLLKKEEKNEEKST